MGDFIVYINGNFINENNARIPFNDAGFLYGDGLFETIRFNNETLFYPEKHLSRLRSGLLLMNISIQNNDSELIEILNELILKNNLKNGLLRLMITRGEISGSPWSFPGPSNLYINIRSISQLPKIPVKVVFLPESDYPIIRFNPAIKSMNYIGNMRAKNDAENLSAYEPVFYNNDSIITECAIRNIFFIKNKILLTPSLDLGVLPGVMRDIIIEIANSMNLRINECHINFSDINTMDESFISSTGIGLLPVYWDSWKSNYNITKKIKKCLDDRMSK